MDIDKESQKRLLGFVDKNIKAKKPFYAAYWPTLVAFTPDPRHPEKNSFNKNILQDALVRLDGFIGNLKKELEGQLNTFLVIE